MSAALAAALVGSGQPQKVLLTIAGLVAGDVWSLAASTPSTSWTVPGAAGASDGSAVTLVDDRCPLNVIVTWDLTVAGVIVDSATLTVPASSPIVLASLDGALVAPVDLATGDLPRTGSPRVAVVRPAGRDSSVVFSDIAGRDTWKWAFETDQVSTPVLSVILKQGRPVVLRSSPGYGDLPGTLIVQPTAWSSVLLSPLGGPRTWSISAEEIDEPEPGTAQVAFSWAYIDGLGLTWDELDALGLTWDQLDSLDWSTLA